MTPSFIISRAVRLRSASSRWLQLPTTATTAVHIITSSSSRRTMVSASSVLLEQKILKLPGLGDSITEGAIVEWTAAVGQAVKEGDVVAMVETDKVTVDIKAEMDGVVVEHCANLDDSVEVGADLYKIDTEAEATVSTGDADSKPAAADAPEPASTKPQEDAPAVSAKADEKPSAPSSSSSSNSNSSHRTPSIRFLGKEGWAKAKAEKQTPTVFIIPSNYGRPAFTEEEMEALVMGGANLKPMYNHSPQYS